MGRTFQESLQKALRGLEIGKVGLDPTGLDLASEDDLAALRRELQGAGPGAPVPRRRRVPRRHERGGRARAVVHRSVVPRPDRGDRRRREATSPRPGLAALDARAHARAQAQGLLRRAPGAADRHRRDRRARAAPRVRRAPGVQARGLLRRRVRHHHRLPVLDLRGRVRGQPDRPRQDHGARRRPEPHRPGHRVRLLLRARRARAARGRLRNHHGQLQPGDRVDRLRHLRPPVLRAADARGRAGDRRPGEAEGRDRAVRRPDAAEAGARAGSRRRADHRHLARLASTWPRTASASSSWSRSSAWRSRPTAPRATPRRRCVLAARDRLPAGGAPELRARRPRDGDRLRRRRPGALHPRRGEGVQRFAGAARPLPRQRGRGRRRRHRRQGRQRADRRRHGAHRGGRRALGRLVLLAAAVLADAGDPGRAARAGRRAGQGAEGRRPDEHPVRDQPTRTARTRSTCSR